MMTDCDKPFNTPPESRLSDVPSDMVRIRELTLRQYQVVTNLAKGRVAAHQAEGFDVGVFINSKIAEGKGFIRLSEAEYLENMYKDLKTPEELQTAGKKAAIDATQELLGGIGTQVGNLPEPSNEVKQCGQDMRISGLKIAPDNGLADAESKVSTLALLAAKKQDIQARST